MRQPKRHKHLFLRRAISNKYFIDKLKDDKSIKSTIIDEILLVFSKNDKELGLNILSEFLSELDILISNSNIIEVRNKLLEKLIYYNKDKEFVYIKENGSWAFNEEMKGLIKLDLESIKIESNLNELELFKMRIIFQYYDDIIKGYSNREHLAPMIKRLTKRFEDIRKVIEIRNDDNSSANFTIVSLKDVNIHMRKILPLLFCKQLYDEQKNTNDNTTYLNLIIDEAHNILSRMSERESEQWKDYRLETFEEIIKEGRKFGVFLTLASQRPSDISSTILSQLHNFFLHRLINNNDIIAIEKSISYLDKLSFEYLPILPTGTCILAGLVANVPVIIDIGKIEDGFEPENKTINLIKNWEIIVE